MSMHPFFMAHGPAIKENYMMKPFQSVDIYSLLCHLLGIEPSPNNGSMEHVRLMLKGTDISRATSAKSFFALPRDYNNSIPRRSVEESIHGKCSIAREIGVSGPWGKWSVG